VVLQSFPVLRTQLHGEAHLGEEHRPPATSIALFQQNIDVPPETSKLTVCMATKSGDQQPILEWDVCVGETRNVVTVIDSAIGAIHSMSVLLTGEGMKIDLKDIKKDDMTTIDLSEYGFPEEWGLGGAR